MKVKLLFFEWFEEMVSLIIKRYDKSQSKTAQIEDEKEHEQ